MAQLDSQSKIELPSAGLESSIHIERIYNFTIFFASDKYIT